jgi:hypothetical protein
VSINLNTFLIKINIFIGISLIIGFISSSYPYLALAYSFCIPMLFIASYFVKYYKQEQLIMLLFAFMPFYAILRATALYYNISLVSTTLNYFRDSIILLCILLLLIKNGKNRCIAKGNMSFNLVDRAIILLLFNYILGFLISLVWGNSILAVKGLHLSLFPILLYFVTRTIKFDQRFMEKVFKVIILTGIIAAISGMYFYFLKPVFFGNLFQVFRATDEDVDVDLVVNYARMVGVYFSPNVFGCFMAINVTIVSILLLYKKSLFYYISLTFCLIGLIFSLSRGSWVFAVAGITTGLLFNIRYKVLQKKILIFLLLLLVTLITLLNIFVDSAQILLGRVNTLFSLNNESTYGRVDNWILYFEKLKQHPEGFGIGVGSQAMTGNLKVISETGINVIDGFFAKTLIETGVLGILIVILSFAFIIKELSTLRAKELWGKQTVSITLALFIGLLFQQFGSNILDFVSIAPYFWAFLGLSMNESIRINGNINGDV